MIPSAEKSLVTGSWVAAVLAALILGVSGCAGARQERPKPISVNEIVETCKAGTPAQEVIGKIRDSGTVYRLKASQLVKLKEQGVPDEVLDYMQETYLHAVRCDQAFEDASRWRMDSFGYWYGGAPCGWPREVWYIERRPAGRRDRDDHGRRKDEK